MRLATWSLNSLAMRLSQVLDWLATNPVDALVLQEAELTDDKSSYAEGAPWPYYFVRYERVRQ